MMLLGILVFTVSCSETETAEKISSSMLSEGAEPSIGIGRDKSAETEPEIEYEPKNYTICVDPGHGFVDGGTGEGVFENGILEKDVNLAVSKLIVHYLEKRGFNVIMTHDGVNIPKADVNNNKIFNAEERAAYANTLAIDYFVSIHVNSIDDTSIYGAQIYWEQEWHKVNEWSQPIAESIAEAFDAAFPDYKKMRVWGEEDERTLAVTRETKAAASLIEIGFCTNETDRNNMVDPEWQAVFAEAVADGINNFFTARDN
jgi:N-acetylmuramoyl-L-alanine amidase